MKSSNLTAVDSPQIPLRLRRAVQAVDPRLVTAQPSMLGAIKLCISLGGFESEKVVYGDLGIDAGHWSRIHRGEAHFPVDKLTQLMDLCGNEAPLIWLTNARGYEATSLRKRESETERALREAHEALDAERVRTRILTEALHGKVAA
jgi:hypothetical protein